MIRIVKRKLSKIRPPPALCGLLLPFHDFCNSTKDLSVSARQNEMYGLKKKKYDPGSNGPTHKREKKNTFEALDGLNKARHDFKAV